jgi:alpha-tubulin suppressor-like RCC1 family protein
VALAAIFALAGFASAAGAAPAGQLYGSGYNDYGGLGGLAGETVGAFTPIEGLSSVVQASPGYYDSLALLSDGMVQASGYNEYGQLGDGSTTERKSFGVVPGVSNVTSVAEGYYASYALLSNGTVEAWGYGGYGELGNGEAEESDVPVQVQGVGGTGTLSGVSAISAGAYDAVALLEDGTVVDWGYGDYGELGDGEYEESDVPVQVQGVGGTGVLSKVVAISAGGYENMALLSNGTVVDWGYGYYGELGNGKAEESDVPVRVQGVGGTGTLSGVSAISAGGYFNMALLADGTVATWGYGYYSELGNGTSGAGAQQDSPVAVPGLSGVSAISAGSYYALALGQDGSLDGWGYGGDEELGNESSEEVASPVRIGTAPAGVFSLGHGDFNYDSLIIQGATASLSAASLSFPSETVGATSPAQSVTLKNEGPATLTVPGEVLAGAGASAFAKTADTCSGATLAAGATCTVTFTFTPSAAGAASATLAFTTSAANTLPAVTLSGSGASPVTTSTTPTTTTTSSTGSSAVAGIAHAAGSAAVKGRKALVKLTCTGEGACNGSLKLVARVVQKGTAKGQRRKRVREIVIGTASFSIAEGKTETLRVHLSAKASSLLGKAGRRGLKLRVTGSDVKAGALVLRQARAASEDEAKVRGARR